MGVRRREGENCSALLHRSSFFTSSGFSMISSVLLKMSYEIQEVIVNRSCSEVERQATRADEGQNPGAWSISHTKESTPPAHAPGHRDVSARPLNLRSSSRNKGGIDFLSGHASVLPYNTIDFGAYRLVPGTDMWTVSLFSLGCVLG